MIACYDLARCPPTYDAVAFLALAEVERKRRGDEHIDVCILPGPAGGFRCDSLWPHSVEERVKLRDSVLVPLCWLLPSVRSVEVAPDRRSLASEWGAGQYYIGLPQILDALRAGSRPLGQRGARHPHLITLTLREADHWPLRNSRVEEWARAARELDGLGRQVVVIRDSARAGEPLDGITTDPVTSRDLPSRALLYRWASLNVGVSNGPMWMSIFMGAPTLMLRPTTHAAGGCYDNHYYTRCGLPPGSQLPTSPPYQRLVWQEDTCENIVRAVEEMLCAA